MTISVDIADRLYDYTDEEKAAVAIADYQASEGIDDPEVMRIWLNETDPRRTTLERVIFEAVDANGSVKRAQTSIPAEVHLSIYDDEEV